MSKTRRRLTIKRDRGEHVQKIHLKEKRVLDGTIGSEEIVESEVALEVNDWFFNNEERNENEITDSEYREAEADQSIHRTKE